MKRQTIQIGNVIFYDKPESISIEPAKTTLQGVMSRADELFEFVKEKFQNRAVAVIEVDVENKKNAVEAAEPVAEQALNVLRFYLSKISPQNPIYYNMYMGLEGTTFTGTTMFLDVTNASEFSTSSDRRGALFPYHIELDTYDNMMQLHLDQINTILCKPDEKQTPFERILLTAINYYGYAMNEHIPRNAFIYFVTSLEALLLKRDEPKAPKLTERIDIILERAYRNKDSIADRIKRIYDMRSDIVHDGIDKVTKNDLYNVSQLAFYTMIKVIANVDKIPDRATFRKKLAELKAKPAEFKF